MNDLEQIRAALKEDLQLTEEQAAALDKALNKALDGVREWFNKHHFCLVDGPHTGPKIPTIKSTNVEVV